MVTSLHSVRKAAVGAVGAGMVTGAMLFGGTPIAQAAPPPAPGTSFEMAGPHGAPSVPLRGGGGHGGGGHGGGGHGGGGHGGAWGGRGGWGGPGGWGGRGGGWSGRGGHPGWGNGGWGPPGLGYRPWWNWWW
ncbi:MAG: hypothetical protein QOG75_6002 [Mycobacterium sp.]|jgi:hypothetical protein|nr:hypothetical protein [Mycobacterium sp.]